MALHSADGELRQAVCSHCSTVCGVLVNVDRGQPVGIAGDPDHPLSRGFICKRGLAAIEYFHHPGRLNRPLRRLGRRGEGRWETVGWDEALDDIASRLLAIRAQSGPEAVAYLSGTFHGADQGIGIRFMNLFGSPNYGGTSVICLGPKMVGEALTFGFGPSASDIRPGETRTLLLWGHHPSASRPRVWGRMREAQRAGARLIVVDPIRTAEAQAADLWLQLRPGSDAALALAVLHVIFDEGLWDGPFVERWCVGFDELRQRSAAYEPERVAEWTWLAPEQIRECARLYAGQPPSALSHGSPNGMGRNALSLERALATLIAVTGNLDRRGGNILQGPPLSIQSKVDAQLYDLLPPEQRAKRLGGDRFRLHVEGYERLTEAARRLWPGHRRLLDASYAAAAHPPSIFRAILSRQPYPVRALLVQHNNPLGTFPNAGLVRDALRSDNLDLLVVHELSMTATAQYADYVLPAASWLEKSYMYVTGFGATTVAAAAAVPPRHERHGDYELVRDLGRRLGQTERWPATLEGLWDEMLAPAGLTFAELVGRKQHWIDEPTVFQKHEQPDSETRKPLGFGTPSGRVELASSILAELGFDPLPSYEPPRTEPDEEMAYPLLLMTGATNLIMTHQDHRQVASLRRQHPDPTVRIHPRTAEGLGLQKGGWVWIETPGGRIRQRVELDDRMHPRVVDAERWWYPERAGTAPALFGVFETNVNVLTEDNPDLCDPAHGGWPYRLGRCRISPADPA
ncbi:MAG: molybdopterin-dependent oxidoreductase [Chloroflexi bacterium]|nr:molybdopterin-dependent oxidoreductase [Chloroflexota bacterium]